MGTTTFLVSTSAGSADPRDVPVRVADKIRDDDMTLIRPWDGDHPPRYIFADSVFVRRDDGIWCKKDAVSRLYLVNVNGERCARPRSLDMTTGQKS